MVLSHISDHSLVLYIKTVYPNIDRQLKNIHVRILRKNVNAHVMGVFLDFSKASNSLDHNLLLRKMDNYGIRIISHVVLHRGQY